MAGKKTSRADVDKMLRAAQDGLTTFLSITERLLGLDEVGGHNLLQPHQRMNLSDSNRRVLREHMDMRAMRRGRFAEKSGSKP